MGKEKPKRRKEGRERGRREGRREGGGWDINIIVSFSLQIEKLRCEDFK